MNTPPRSGTPARHAPSAGRPVAALAAILLSLLIAAPVLAHAELVSSDPAEGAVLAGPPDAITLVFNGPLVAGRSFFELVGPAGSMGRGEVDAERQRRLVLAAAALTTPLGPGDYEVRWRAVADDGHDELKRGIVRFTVSEPTPVAATPPPTSPTPGASGEPAPATAAPLDPVPAASGGDALVPIVVGLAVVAGVGAYVLRRSRRA